ncbi:protein HIRA-like [Montipora capricornis]|uniref:protein HIRA-like n=1 Tax=Montipora capricornis TaxID=246305 RepID=UPI0035F131CA
MRLLKPSWVSHEGRPLFSIDIHPDGSRFAIGGQGDDSGKVTIWNMAPVKNEEDEMNENVPKLLCQMDNHLACVNCVRWSCSGKYLATGGDDKLIMIWQMARYLAPTAAFGGNSGKLNIEQWRCVYTLRGHTGDVLDIAWSPDDSFLASGSVDNTITIWNAQRFPDIMTVLKGHTGLVKGVTWDPVGKYLASQSDDKTLRVWRTADWQQETFVSEPFADCSGTTHVLRLSWSPDGHYVVSAHAMNNAGPVAKILERDGWKMKMDFVGHRKAVTCVRFNPKLFVKKVGEDSARLKQYSCCAIGSRDRSLSVWLTSLKRPLVVIHDLFNHSVMDVSWSDSGSQLLVCSWDGTVAYADFTTEELGRPMSEEEKEKFHKQVYGISIRSSKSNFASAIIENPEMLKIQQRHVMKQQTLANTSKPNAPPPPLIPATETPTKQETSSMNGNVSRSPTSTSYLTSPITKSPLDPNNVRERQIETRTKDGRRRITPLLVSSVEVSDSPMPFGVSSPAVSAPGNSSLPNTSQTAASIPTTTQTLVALDSRIGENATTGFTSKSIADKAAEKVEIASVKPVSTTTMKPMMSSVKPPSSSSTTATSTSAATTTSTTVAVKRKSDTHTASHAKRARKDGSTSGRSSSGSSANKQREDRADQEETSDASLHGRHIVAIPYPVPQKTLTVQIKGAGGEAALTLDLDNNLASQGPRVHVLKCSTAGKLLWETVLMSPGIALAGNRQVICVACENRSINLFSSTGRKLLPSMVLDSPASILQCSRHYVMVVTSAGGVYIWDTKRITAVLKNEPVLPLLSGPDVTITRASISEPGFPIITLSNHSSYSYDTSVGAWLQLIQADDLLAINSDHQSVTPPQDLLQAQGPLSQLQGQSSRYGRQSTRLFRSNHGRQQSATAVHLENQLSSSVALGSAKEYFFWLTTYVRYLSQAGFEARLREVCEELLGPPHRSIGHQDKTSGWNPSILGYQKRSLLRQLLPHIGTNIRLQRLFTEFKEQLDALNVL